LIEPTEHLHSCTTPRRRQVAKKYGLDSDSEEAAEGGWVVYLVVLLVLLALLGGAVLWDQVRATAPS
jgi:hypothetical protein